MRAKTEVKATLQANAGTRPVVVLKLTIKLCWVYSRRRIHLRKAKTELKSKASQCMGSSTSLGAVCSGETDANSTAAAKVNVLWKLPLKRCALMKLLEASLEATAN